MSTSRRRSAALATAPGLRAGKETWSCAGRARTVHVVGPSDAPDDEARPLLLVLHGAGGGARSAAAQTGFNRVAHERRWRVAYPEGLWGRWNAWPAMSRRLSDPPDDVAFLTSAVERLTESYAVTTVLATGFSAGAMMVYRLAVAAPELLAAIAPVGGAAPILRPPPAGTVRPFCLHVHGARDRTVPLTGPSGFPPVRSMLRSWVAGPDHRATHERSFTPPTERWTGLYGQAELHIDARADHCWPGGRQLGPGSGRRSGGLDATSLIAQRFAGLVPDGLA